MNVFLIGLYGSLVGGLFLTVTTLLVFKYEKNQANKRADKLMGELKTIYTEKLNQGLVQADIKSVGKYN